mgnify:CR=1 FL=1
MYYTYVVIMCAYIYMYVHYTEGDRCTGWRKCTRMSRNTYIHEHGNACMYVCICVVCGCVCTYKGDRMCIVKVNIR